MTEIATIPPRGSLVQRVAQRYDVDPDKLLTTMKATCFRSEKPITNEQMMALLIVAEQYHLNPFTKELFAFDDKRGGIVPYVSVDGWSRIINEHPHFDGVAFSFDKDQLSMTCSIFRKDRAHPTTVTEYMEECKRGTQPWTGAPRRMLRHKALIQCARLAFGFAGIHDQDEAERIRDIGVRQERPMSQQRARLQRALHGETQDTIEEAEEITGTLSDLSFEMCAIDDPEAAAEVLDRARSILSEEEYSELAGTYAQIFEKDQQP